MLLLLLDIRKERVNAAPFHAVPLHGDGYGNSLLKRVTKHYIVMIEQKVVD